MTFGLRSCRPWLARGLLNRWLLLCMLGLAALAPTSAAWADAAALRGRYVQLSEHLRRSPFGRPLYLESMAEERTSRGEIYAVLEHPFAQVSRSLREPAQWCDVLILPFNTKYCHAAEADGRAMLMVRVGRKYDQPVEDAFRLSFDYANLAAGPDYFESRLAAEEGPFGTHDYRIQVSAIPLERGRTFLHLSYSYGYGLIGHVAMRSYLATIGARKVGFTSISPDDHGRPQYVGGLRGAVERNAMRYYLAIDSYLGSLDAPREQQSERRIQSWFTATERYPRQLHEMDRETYVALKRLEYRRQQAGSSP